MTVGVSDWPRWVARYIAEKKGLFQKNNVAVKLIWYDDYTQSLDDFSAGKLDANGQTWSDTLIGRAKGGAGRPLCFSITPRS